MASWKEKGEVPDSDDEDEEDSLDVPYEGYGQGLLQAPGDVERKQVEGQDEAEDIQKEKIQGHLPTNASKVATLEPQHRQSTSKQASLSPRVFKKPHQFFGLDGLPESQEANSQKSPHVDDEISHSYVRLSSSLSSLDPLPAQLQIATTKQGSPSSRLEDELLIGRDSSERQMGNDKEMLVGNDDFPSNNRRSLRQRNPIQLHPYALEGEKYRRTLMARGMRPLRLAQVQENSRESARYQSSLDSDFEVENESQILSVRDEPELPQSSQSCTSIELSALVPPGRPSTQADGEDDDFPDIDQLLERSNENFVQAGSKRRKTTYASRYSSGKLAGLLRPTLAPNRRISSRETELSHIPPSPPATSPPISIFQAPFSDPRSKYVALNYASSRAVSLEYSGIGKGDTGNLPTPATNLVNHTIDLTTENQSDEDPFSSDTDFSVVSQSCDVDQSMQVRRVGKRIRGVLPASWLRLDQTQQDRNTKIGHREHRNISPIKAALSRRGIAVPKDLTHKDGPTVTRSNNDSHFMLSDSDSNSDDTSSLPVFVEESIPDPFQDSLFSQTDMGSIMEDDRVDAMLPPKMRQSKLFPGTNHRRRQHLSTSLFVKRHSGPGFQPKITDHLREKSGSSNRNHKTIWHRPRKSNPSGQTRSLTSQNQQRNQTPNLSILDVVEQYGDSGERPPSFIRIAARNARSRRGFGRHSPTRKFIKLANRADTQDAQSTLQDWREGTLRPLADVPSKNQHVSTRQPLSSISGNIQNPAASAPSAESDLGSEVVDKSVLRRKVLVSRSTTQPRLARSTESRTLGVVRNGSAIQTKPVKNRIQASKINTSAARPAQLETSISDYGARHPSAAFGSTKKMLDTLYSKARKANKTRGDIQLARFFGDKSTPQNADTHIAIKQVEETPEKSGDQIRPARRRKRVPQHVDANAAVFRQPNEPLILDFLQLTSGTQEKYGQDGKLLGLGNFGTSYTHHFDIFPLQSGVFFHSSTFIGSGRLSRALEVSLNQCYDDRGYFEFQLAGKQFRWGIWNETVSSEAGMCFDWIIEQLEDYNAKPFNVEGSDLIGCLTNMIDYIQTSLCFSDSASRSECVLRLVEVLFGFTKQVELQTRRNSSAAEGLRVLVEISCLAMVLSFQILKVAQSDPKEIGMTHRLESLLQKTATLTVSLLLSLGLAPVRNLYDDLQYLAYRETGIHCDRYVAQAWVMVIHTVHTAQIPRVSFWDVVNSQLVNGDEARLNDARTLERMWYDMFSLLPLTDFDTNGTLIPGIRLSRSFENWALPQRIAKKIFELYNSKSRQSPSFNDYCRALFSRCSHLMQIWGWRRHGIIVGTLFDFFATRKLAHLRNEEVYRSPRFLEELDKDPSLTVDPEDRCFHILLKIIAISIKQMREAEDAKGIRNLVTRVLPNHDRQYPKEKTVHQRDLASLRNHHDILCTLFWAAPTEFRPPITLIRELVNPESSHQEAYLINLRSWENLTRFILAFTPTPIAYLPLATWQNESFKQLLAQHQSAETDIQVQLRNLPAAAKQLISQHTVTRTIEENKNQIVMALARSLRSIKGIIEAIPNIEIYKVVVNNDRCIDSIKNGLDMFRFRHDEDLPVVEAALDIIHCYVTRLLESGLISDFKNRASEDDSQEYGRDVFADVPVEIFEYIGHLNGDLMAGVRRVLHTSLLSGHPIRRQFRKKIVETWALIAATLILAKYYDLSDFLADSGPFNELSMVDQDHGPRHYAPSFLGILAKVLGDNLRLNTTGRDLLSDWLCILINPIACFAFEHKLLPVFAMYETVVHQASSIFQCRKPVNKADISTLDGIKSGRVDLIHDTLQAMELVLRDKPSERRRYRKIIRRMLVQMKADLGAMDPRSPEIEQYQQFVTSVHSDLTTFFHNVSTSDLEDEFFSTTSTYPAEDDSHKTSEKFCDIVRNYGLRLGTARGKNELNHYVLAVLKYAAVKGNLQEISQSTRNAMDYEQGTWADLSHHILTVLTPSFIHAAFVSEPGWLLAEPLFEAAQDHLMDIADCDRKGALTGVSKIMSSIVLGIVVMMEAHSSDNVRAAASCELVYVLLMSTRFMALAFDWLPFSMELCKEKNQDIALLLEFFYRFACGAKAYFGSPLEWFIDSLPRYFQSISGLDDRKLLVRQYEAAMRQENNEPERERALEMLAEPFVLDNNERNLMKTQIADFHNHKFMSALWLFNHMRHSDFFCNAACVVKTSPDLNIAQFSGIILEDYRQNWAVCSKNGDFEIKFGQERLIARGLMTDGRSLETIFDALTKSLNDYTSCYERVYRSAAQIVRDEWPHPDSGPSDLIL